MLEDNAFHQYLLTLSRGEAAAYLYHCMANGFDGPNAAWELWESVHGARCFTHAELPGAFDTILDRLKREVPVRHL